MQIGTFLISYVQVVVPCPRILLNAVLQLYKVSLQFARHGLTFLDTQDIWFLPWPTLYSYFSQTKISGHLLLRKQFLSNKWGWWSVTLIWSSIEWVARFCHSKPIRFPAQPVKTCFSCSGKIFLCSVAFTNFVPLQTPKLLTNFILLFSCSTI